MQEAFLSFEKEQRFVLKKESPRHRREESSLSWDLDKPVSSSQDNCRDLKKPLRKDPCT
jgi:hypothetical protein